MAFAEENVEQFEPMSRGTRLKPSTSVCQPSWKSVNGALFVPPAFPLASGFNSGRSLLLEFLAQISCQSMAIAQKTFGICV